MKRIALAAMPAAGHVNPSVPIVRELVRRKIDVTYYATEEFRGIVERTGAEFRPYPDGAISPTMIAEATRSGGPIRVVSRVLRATETLLPFLLDEFHDHPPGAVAYDSNALWGRMAADRLGLPRISLMTTMLLGPDGMRRLSAREWLAFLKETLPAVPDVLGSRRRALQRFDRQAFPASPIFPMRGDLTIFPIPRWLQIPDPRIDEACHYVGPTIEAPSAHDQDAELAGLLRRPDPLILVSLGTLHAGDAFFRSCFEALGDLPATVLIAAGTGADPARLGTPPANTVVRASVPQREVLEHSSVFVTHGGMNSALEGLHSGVPLVFVPQQVEQLIIGQAVAERGAGVVLRHNLARRRVPPAELRSAVEACLDDPARRAAAQTLRAGLSDGGGASAAADLVTNLLAPAR